MIDMAGELKDKVTEVIRNSVISTFHELFQVHILSEKRTDHTPRTGELSCRVDLFQEDIEATLRFTFERELLYKLIEDMYPSDVLEDEKTFEDAACEIANIVCCRVKAFLNTQGYNMSMKIPYPEKAGEPQEQSKDAVHLGFSLKEEDFSVNFDMVDSRFGIGV